MSARLGRIVLLNGAPRAGKSSLVAEIQNTYDGLWLNLGVDRYMAMIPRRYQPGIGLRPGGERPDLEPLVEKMYLALYDSIAAHSRRGINVVTDVGHHDFYANPMNLLPRCCALLAGLPALLVGVTCPLDAILERRAATGYLTRGEDGSVPPPVARWQESVHEMGHYDLMIDTSVTAPFEGAALIREKLGHPEEFTAVSALAALIE